MKACAKEVGVSRGFARPFNCFPIWLRVGGVGWGLGIGSERAMGVKAPEREGGDCVRTPNRAAHLAVTRSNRTHAAHTTSTSLSLNGSPPAVACRTLTWTWNALAQ